MTVFLIPKPYSIVSLLTHSPKGTHISYRRMSGIGPSVFLQIREKLLEIEYLIAELANKSHSGD
jgi:hypothetical protein